MQIYMYFTFSKNRAIIITVKREQKFPEKTTGGAQHEEAERAAELLLSPVRLMNQPPAPLPLERRIHMRKLNELLSSYYHLFA